MISLFLKRLILKKSFSTLSSLLTLLFVFSFTSISLSSENSENETIIDIDYLKKFPKSNYMLGVGDELRIVASRDYPELNAAVKISDDGTIYLPKLNKVFISGLTLNELTLLLNKAYLEYVKFPDVEIEMVNYRSISVTVQGEVEKPKIIYLEGSQSIELLLRENNSNKDNNNLQLDNFKTRSYFPNILDAIRASGGITNYSDLENIKIIRKNDLSNGGGKKKASINLFSILRNNSDKNILRIYDEDIIIVGKLNYPNKNSFFNILKNSLNPNFLNVTISGKVEEPGLKKLPLTSYLNNAIEVSGGTKVLPGKIKLIRFSNSGLVSTTKIKYSKNAKIGSKNNPLLKNGDLIFVEKSFLNNTSEIISEITNPLSGALSAYGLIKIISD